MKSVTGRLVVGLSLALAALPGCGLEPSGGRHAARTGNSATLQLSFDADDFSVLSADLNQLRVRIYPVEGGRDGPQEGPDQFFPLSPDTVRYSFVVRGLTLGDKDFNVAVLSSRQEVLGSASFTATIVPGAQTLAMPVVLNVKAGAPTRDVKIVTTVSVADAATPSYADVAPIFAASCVGCHATGAASGGLNLESFPFRSTRLGNDQSVLVAKILARMTDADDPMPPDDPLDDATIKRVATWHDAGDPAVPPTTPVVATLSLHLKGPDGATTNVDATRDGSSDRFVAQAPALAIGATYQLSLTAATAAGIVLWDGPAADQFVDATSDLAVSLSIPYVPPTLSIPIEIHPEP